MPARRGRGREPLARRHIRRTPYLLLIAALLGLVAAFALLGRSGPPGLVYDASAQLLLKDGKVLVLYVGAEYCPFCAAERWAIVMALSKYGTWSHLQPTTSAPASIEPSLPNLPTYTFVNAIYSSDVVAFEAYEIQDRFGTPLQNLSALAQQLLQRYDPSRSIPFLCIGGKYYRVGSGVDPSLLVGKSFDEVKAQLEAKQGPIYDAVSREAALIAKALDQLLGRTSGLLQRAVALAEVESLERR